MGQAKICLDFSGMRSRRVGAAGPCIGFFLCFFFFFFFYFFPWFHSMFFCSDFRLEEEALSFYLRLQGGCSGP